MLYLDGPFFVLIPGSSKANVLRPGKVIELDGATFVAELDEMVALESGADVIIYGTVNGRFFQQGAKVAAIHQAEPTVVIGFVRLGDPVSAEQRQTYRVSTVTSGILAKVDGESSCAVVDVSPEGFAVVTGKQYAIGSVANVIINHKDVQISTPARVQTVKALPNGKFRHGFRAGERKSPTRKSLEQISIAMQREQLRRVRACGAA